MRKGASTERVLGAHLRPRSATTVLLFLVSFRAEVVLNDMRGED